METSACSAIDRKQLAERPWLALYPAGAPADLKQSACSPLEHFSRACAHHAAAVAVWYFDTPITYAQLDAQADALAEALEARGVRAGERIGVLNQNTPATLIAVVASWRIGAIVVPMNPMLTAREVRQQVEDSGTCAVIAGADCVGALPPLAPASSLRVVFVAFAHDFLEAGTSPELLRGAVRSLDCPAGWFPLMPLLEKSCPPREDALPPGAQIAFLTYTSGTTGAPKGALNTHANVAFSAEVFRLFLQLDERDVLLACAPFSHITGLVGHIATAFASGAPLVLCYRFDAGTVLGLIESRGCTSTVAAITAYIALLNHASFDPRRLRTFRKLYSGGAPVAPGVVARWEQATGTYIHNAYGLTETTSPSHLTPLGARAPVDAASGALSVGVPVPSTYCRIVDPQTGVDVAPGEAGELLTCGPQVMAGYWQQPEQTASSLVGGRWLRTGDICRCDPQGWFYIVDRAKDVIVASGFKVWPREVEDVLVSHPAVSEAAVIGIPDEYRGESPKAFVVLRPGEKATKEALRDFCRSNLAAYKLPREIELVSELPKTAAGKILRRVLREEN